MTTTDKLDLLRQKVAETSQAQVARQLGYAPTTISQVLSGSYAGNLDHVLLRVEEVYGNTTVSCPGLGEEIALGRCAEWRKKAKDFAATNPQRVRMYRACRQCPHKR